MTNAVNKIAEFIRKGWRLSSLHCPVCNAPLVSKEERYFCAICNREVKVVRSEDEYREIVVQNVLNQLKMNIIDAIQKIFVNEKWYLNKENLELLTAYLNILKAIKELSR